MTVMMTVKMSIVAVMSGRLFFVEQDHEFITYRVGLLTTVKLLPFLLHHQLIPCYISLRYHNPVRRTRMFNILKKHLN